MRKTKYKSITPVSVKGWKQGWGARGITVMNDLEIFDLTNRHQKGDKISTRDKLSVLLKIYRANRFYKSLRSQIQMGHKLSQKQAHVIEDDYRSKIKKIVSNSDEPVKIDIP